MNSWKKRCTAALTAAAMVLSLCAVSFAAGSLDHFQKIKTYEPDTFSDINGWYEPYVIRGYELGLFDGTGNGRFSPESSMTVGEAVKLAACLHKTYQTGNADFPPSLPWWEVYSNYCIRNHIMDEAYSDYSNAITRAEFAVLFSAALPDSVLTVMNEVPDDAIPDVQLSDSYGPAVYRLYRAGILTGSDSRGTFRPATNLRRSEMAAIITRMVCVPERKSISLSPLSNSMNGEQIYERCASSVFAITTFDGLGTPLSTGSGVFLTEDGEAITNWHILDGADKAEITAIDGKKYPVSGVLAYDPVRDLALIRIFNIHAKPMKVNTAGALLTGSAVYAIGNPLGLESSMSAGIVAASHREIHDLDYIQTTAPISSGSSGGALINDRGELVGITSASVRDGQNLNLAIPIQAMAALDRRPLRSVADVMDEYVQQLIHSLEISDQVLYLAPKQSALVTCTLPHIPTGYSLSYHLANPSVARCKWGVWDNGVVQLTVTGRSNGTASISLELHNRQDVVLDTRTVKVVVR